MASPRRFLAVVLIIVPALGCSSGGPVPVEGIVTLDGKPVPAASITFIPVDTEKGRMAHGRSDADGSFRLTTFRTDDGALPGEYKVVIKVVSEDKSLAGTGKDPMQMSDEEKRKFFMRPAAWKESRGSTSSSASGGVPQIYGDPENTPLKEVVPPPGKIELKLRSTVR